MDVATPRSTVGPTKKPSSCPATTSPRPSATASAPPATASSMKSTTRCLDAAVMTGPIVVAAWSPGPTTIALASLVSSAMSASPAPLTGRPERSGSDLRRRERHVRVGHDDRVVVRTAERLDALAGADGRLLHVPGNRRRPHERDRRDLRVRQQRVDGVLAAVDDLEHAVDALLTHPQ